MTTFKQIRRFFKDMDDPHKQTKYMQFVEAEEARYKAQKIADAMKADEEALNGDD